MIFVYKMAAHVCKYCASLDFFTLTIV